MSTGGELVEPALLANLFDDLGRWWNGLALWQQFLVMCLGVGLLMLGGAGWAFALGAVGIAADLAARGQGIATFLRNPRQATAEFFRTLTPADVISYSAGVVLSRSSAPSPTAPSATGSAQRETRPPKPPPNHCSDLAGTRVGEEVDVGVGGAREAGVAGAAVEEGCGPRGVAAGAGGAGVGRRVRAVRQGHTVVALGGEAGDLAVADVADVADVVGDGGGSRSSGPPQPPLRSGKRLSPN